ncbi:MAG: response regulator transcription factor [Aggregatilineales bacterium]
MTVGVKRLLIVEDDHHLRGLLRQVLSDAGYDVTAVSDGPDALRYIERSGLPHLVLMDLLLPTTHGFQLSERIKRMGDVPIMILTGESDADTVVRGISEYAEDYLIKPLNMREVTARVGRILSRIHDFSYADGPILKVDESVAVDFAHNMLIVNGATDSLTPIEARLLSTLTQNSGRVLSAEQLIARVWLSEAEFIPEETLRVHLSRLRHKLAGGKAGSDYIQTERGLGYRFSFPDSR